MSPWSAARRAVRYMGIIQCHCGSLGSARPSIRHKRPSTRAKRIGLSQESFLGSIPSECRCDENANNGAVRSQSWASQSSIGFAIELIHSRICGNRNSLLSIAFVMKLWASSGSTSRKYPFTRSITSVRVKLSRLFPSIKRGCFPATPSEPMLPQTDRCSSHFVVGKWPTPTIPCLGYLGVRRIPR